MKYVVMLCDGMADRPIEALNGRTPLETAETPTMDRLAAKGEVGMVRTVPDGIKPGSDVANLSVLGYDVSTCYTGRSPLEAANIGIDLADDDVAIRCNLVTLGGEGALENRTMDDYCSGDIATEQADVLVKALQRELGGGEFDLYTGTAYRHCLVWHGGRTDVTLTPPHDISGQPVAAYLPTGAAAPLRAFMDRAAVVLSEHPLNRERKAAGLAPANAAWLWGQGSRPQLQSFEERYGYRGAMVSAVDLLKGIARLTGMRVCEVEGATGYVDTNYEGKRDAALAALREGADLAYLHVEAPDECGHRGERDLKVQSIADIDRRIMAPLVAALDAAGEPYRILLLPDHPTPLCVRTHTAEPVPYLLYGTDVAASGVTAFSEAVATSTGRLVEPGYTLIRRLIRESDKNR